MARRQDLPGQCPVPGAGLRARRDGRLGAGGAPDRDRPRGQLPGGHRPGGGAGPGPARVPRRAQGDLRRRDPKPRGDRGRRRAARSGCGPRGTARPARPERERAAARRAGGALPTYARRPVRQPATAAGLGADRRPVPGVRHRGLRRRPAARGGRQSVRDSGNARPGGRGRGHGGPAPWSGPAGAGVPRRTGVLRARVAASLAGVALAAAGLCAVNVAPARADAVRDQQMWVLDMVHAPSAWPVSQGQHVIVAVIDSGVFPTVSDLDGSVISGPDLSGVNTPQSNASWGIHGTWMASLIAGHGHGDGSSGIEGVAPAARVLSIRVVTDRGDPNFGMYEQESNSQVQAALARAITIATRRGAQVISMSLGYGAPSRVVRQALQNAEAHGVVVVASSGNSGDTARARNTGQAPYSFPADYPGVLGVGAVTETGSAATFSSDNLSVAVAAPGVKVPAQGRDGQYWLVSGTSPACALTAGVAALIRSVYPTLAPALVVQAITGSTSQKPHGRYDEQVGFGTVDATAALKLAGRLARDADRGRGVKMAAHFGGGAGATSAVPVAPRGKGRLALYALLLLACLAVAVVAATRLTRRRQAASAGAGPWPGGGPGSRPWPGNRPGPDNRPLPGAGPRPDGRPRPDNGAQPVPGPQPGYWPQPHRPQPHRPQPQGPQPQGPQPYGSQPHGSQPYGAQQYGSQPYGSPSYGSQPYGPQPHGSQPYGPPSYGPPSYGSPSYGSPSYGPQPYGAQPYGPEAHGSQADRADADGTWPDGERWLEPDRWPAPSGRGPAPQAAPAQSVPPGAPPAPEHRPDPSPWAIPPAPTPSDDDGPSG